MIYDFATAKKSFLFAQACSFVRNVSLQNQKKRHFICIAFSILRFLFVPICIFAQKFYEIIVKLCGK